MLKIDIEKIFRVSRIVAGVLFLAYGLNDLLGLGLLPKVTSSPQAIETSKAIKSTSYYSVLFKVVEICLGVSFLTNRFIFLITISIFMPFSINYFFYCLFVNLPGLPMATLSFLFMFFLLYYFKDKLKNLI